MEILRGRCSTHDSQVRRPVNKEFAIHHTTQLPREHSARPDGMMHGIQHLLRELPQLLVRLFTTRHDPLHDQILQRLRRVHLTHPLQRLDQDVQVGFVGEVVLLDRWVVFGVGGVDVHGAAVEGVRVGAEEGEVAFGEVGCHAGDGEMSVEHQESAGTH